MVISPNVVYHVLPEVTQPNRYLQPRGARANFRNFSPRDLKALAHWLEGRMGSEIGFLGFKFWLFLLGAVRTQHHRMSLLFL